MNQFSKKIVAGSLVGIAALIACVFAFFSKPTKKENIAALVTEIRAKPSTLKPSSATKSPLVNTTPIAGTQDSATMEKARETAIDRMKKASITYDPAQLPVIQPYLLDPDPEIRLAAIDAMIVLGDASAGPMLREAAKSAATAKNAVALEEAANYVELPPADFGKISKKIKGSTHRPEHHPKKSE